VVARQTFWTRRAVEVAEQGTGRGDQDPPRRARIGATTNGPVLWPPFQPSSLGKANQLEVGHEFILPRDAKSRVMLRLFLEVPNHEDYPVTITLNELSRAEEEAHGSLPSEWPIPKDSTENFRFDTSRTVAEWVAIHRGSHVEGIGAPEFQATVGHSDPYDDGVIDSWLRHRRWISLSPGPRQRGPLGDRTRGAHRHPCGSLRRGLVRPMKRRYYVSKNENTPL